MVRRGLIVTLAIALAAGVALIPTEAASAQKIADEPSRREAIQHFRAGQELMSGEQFERAAVEFGKATSFDPMLSIAHYQLGQAYMNLRRYASAAKAYRDSIEAMRELHALQQTDQFRADKLREDEKQEMRESIRVMEQLAAKHPNQGYALKVTQAEQHLRDLESRSSSVGSPFRPPAEALLALGSAYFRNGDREAAEANWKAAVDVNSRYGEAHNNLAVIYMQTDRFEQALTELALAEKNGFKVNPQFKADLKERAKAKR